MGVRYLYLIRHGQYFTDDGHASCGSLTPLGRRQGIRVARRLSSLPRFDAVFSSDSPRAIETTEIALETLGPLPWKRFKALREGLPGWAPDWPKELDPGRAELRATQARMRGVFDKHFKPTRSAVRRELFVVHGNLIRYLTRLALGDPPSFWWRMAIQHCSLTVFAVVGSPPKCTLIQFGDVGHLPVKMQTFA